LKFLVPVHLDVEVAEVAVDLDVEDSAEVVEAAAMMAATEKEVAEAMAEVEEEEAMEAVAEDLAVGTERILREDGIEQSREELKSFSLFPFSHSVLSKMKQDFSKTKKHYTS